MFTDGSTRIKNKRGAENIGGWGYVVFDNGVIVDARADQVKNTTNNEMELIALFYAMTDYPNARIYSDSAYAINCITNWAFKWEKNGWVRPGGLPIQNLTVIKFAYLFYKNMFKGEIIKCAGHNNIKGNELADDLAAGRKTPRQILEEERKYINIGIKDR